MASYPIPGYLEHPADLAGNLLSGFHAGAAVAGEQARLDMEAQQAGIQMAERKQQMQMEQARQQQQLEMTRAYHEAQIGLRKSQLEQAQQKIQLATVQAAHKFQAQQNVQRRISELTTGGMPLPDATRTAFMENASTMGMTGQGVAALTQAPKHAAWIPEDLQTGAPGHFESAAGGVTVPTRLKEQGQLTQKDILQTLRQKEKELAADPLVKAPIPKNADPAMRAEAQRRKDEYKKVTARIDSMIPEKAAPPAGLAAAGPLPLPKEKKDLVKGQVYQTKRGPARWDGNQFQPEQGNAGQ